MNPSQASSKVKAIAKELGFISCGVAKAGFLEEEAPLLEQWLSKGYHGTMSYMERNFDARLDPTVLVPGAKSVITVLYNYYPEEGQRQDAPQFSKYAYGRDYHKVIKGKFKTFLKQIQLHVGAVEGRAFVDSAPVLERAWAKRSGLGWIGKHGLLLSKQRGSFFFIGELILDLDLEPDAPTTDHCGTCTACIDACPTGAIIAPEVLDSNKCISYLTIEYKGALPQEYQDKMDGWVYGCDTCQDVCPWNRFSVPHAEPDFKMRKDIAERTVAEWEEVTEELFEEIFKGSAVRRTGYQGLRRNLKFLRNA